jgi:hypothetical protein
MGLRRKFFSINSLGLVPFRSNTDKIAKIAKQDQRKAKVDAKKDRNLQEQILAEQRRANDLKERELEMQYAQAAMEDPERMDWRGDSTRTRAWSESEPQKDSSWWGYSNPAKKDRRG